MDQRHQSRGAAQLRLALGGERLQRQPVDAATQHRLDRLLALLAVEPLEGVLEAGRFEAMMLVARRSRRAAVGLELQLDGDRAAILLLRQSGGRAQVLRLFARLGQGPRVLPARIDGQLSQRREPVLRIGPEGTLGQIDPQHRIIVELAARESIRSRIDREDPD